MNHSASMATGSRSGYNPCMQAVLFHRLLALVLATGISAQSLASLVAEAEAAGMVTAVALRDLNSGRSLYRHRGELGMIPASNQKLLTATGLWSALGIEHEFSTIFRLRKGMLEVVAGGDPNFLVGTRYGPERAFTAVVDALVAAGQRSLRGLVLIPAAFSGPSRPPGWPRNQFSRSYCAPTAGLVLEAGCFAARVSPGTGGFARIEILAPPVHFAVEGRIALTDDKKQGSRFHLAEFGGTLRVSGAYYRKGQGFELRAAVREPQLLFRLALKQALLAAGIEFSADAPAIDRDLLTWRSPLRVALGATLRDSSNFHAEQCLRVLGAEVLGEGSFDAGLRALRAELERFMGELPPSLVLADGSGLSRSNRISADFTVELLDRVLSSSFAKVFLSSLARGGIDGTLDRRFRGPLRGKVRAKTGTLNGVSCLSGVLQDGRGQLRLFSILMNYPAKARPGRPSPRRLQDRMVAAMAEL